MAEAKSKKTLKNCVIAAIGDLGKRRDHKAIQQWVECNSGEFTPTINNSVTHLISSIGEYKKDDFALDGEVRKCNQHVKIVTFDWLEDSLVKGRRKSERPYLLERICKMKERRLEARKQKLLLSYKAFEDGCEGLRERAAGYSYHIYRDVTGYAYDIDLIRSDLLEKSRGSYKLRLFESDKEPRLYTCYVTYSDPKCGASTRVLAPKPSSYYLAMSMFEQFYKQKTGKDWKNKEGDESVAEDPQLEIVGEASEQTGSTQPEHEERPLSRDPSLKINGAAVGKDTETLDVLNVTTQENE